MTIDIMFWFLFIVLCLIGYKLKSILKVLEEIRDKQ